MRCLAMEECLEGEEDCHRRFREDGGETGDGEHFLVETSIRRRNTLAWVRGRETVWAGVM